MERSRAETDETSEEFHGELCCGVKSCMGSRGPMIRRKDEVQIAHRDRAARRPVFEPPLDLSAPRERVEDDALQERRTTG